MKATKLPLKLVNLDSNGFHILVEAVVFNTPVNLVLDTGASKTVFDKEFIEALCIPGDLSVSNQISTGLGATDIQSYTISLKTLSIGKLSLENFEAAVLNLNVIKAAYQNLNLPLVAGVLGGDVLVAHGAVIDYQKLTLKLNLADQEQNR